MGNCLVVDEAVLNSQRLQKEMERDQKAKSHIVKLLLLGTGESGKSTIVKQMEIIQNSEKSTKGFSEKKRRDQLLIIQNNILDSIDALIEAAEMFGYSFDGETSECVKRVKNILNESERTYTDEVASDVKIIWDHETTKKCVQRSSEFQFLDSAPYFLDRAENFIGDYLPSTEDVLRARTITTGISIFPFESKAKTGQRVQFELVDVGGQRTERKKWIHCFDDVTAVMFIISLSDYNQNLYEDETTNRMQESEKLFGQMLNNVFFLDTPFIVFFNKVDLFKEKLKQYPLTIAYEDYRGNQEYDEALKFVRGKFLRHEKRKTNSSRIHPHNTTATDTDLVKSVVDNVVDIIFNMLIGQFGFE